MPLRTHWFGYSAVSDKPALFIPKSAQKNAAALIRSLLPDDHSDVWVATKIPNPRRPRMVRATRNPGGGLTDDGAIDVANMLFEVWADDEGAAEDLTSLVRAILKASPGRYALDAFITGWKEDSAAYEWPDTSGQTRWQFSGRLLLLVE